MDWFDDLSLGHLQIGLKTMTWISVTCYAQCHKPSIWGWFLYIQPIKIWWCCGLFIIEFTTLNITHWYPRTNQSTHMDFRHQNLDRTMKNTDLSINHIKKNEIHLDSLVWTNQQKLGLVGIFLGIPGIITGGFTGKPCVSMYIYIYVYYNYIYYHMLNH